MEPADKFNLICPEARDAVQHWLSHERALKSAADNTVSAYTSDVLSFIVFMARHRSGPQGLVALSNIHTRDMPPFRCKSQRGRKAQGLVGPTSGRGRFVPLQSFP